MSHRTCPFAHVPRSGWSRHAHELQDSPRHRRRRRHRRRGDLPSGAPRIHRLRGRARPRAAARRHPRSQDPAPGRHRRRRRPAGRGPGHRGGRFAARRREQRGCHRAGTAGTGPGRRAAPPVRSQRLRTGADHRRLPAPAAGRAGTPGQHQRADRAHRRPFHGPDLGEQVRPRIPDRRAARRTRRVEDPDLGHPAERRRHRDLRHRRAGGRRVARRSAGGTARALRAGTGPRRRGRREDEALADGSGRGSDRPRGPVT